MTANSTQTAPTQLPKSNVDKAAVVALIAKLKAGK